jgi:hypothetical protein
MEVLLKRVYAPLADFTLMGNIMIYCIKSVNISHCLIIFLVEKGRLPNNKT